jgi:hypothetical protein
MLTPTIAQGARRTYFALLRESNTYSHKKPWRVPPADSRNRPELARLWLAAFLLSRTQAVHTFDYAGADFELAYLGDALCVLDCESRKVLVKSPGSMATLAAITGDSRAMIP